MIRIEPAGYILGACWITIYSLWNLLNHKIYNKKRSFSLVRLGGSSCWQLLYCNEVVKYRNLVRLSGLPSLGIWEICVAVQRIKNSINAWEGRCFGLMVRQAHHPERSRRNIYSNLFGGYLSPINRGIIRSTAGRYSIFIPKSENALKEIWPADNAYHFAIWCNWNPPVRVVPQIITNIQ